MTGFLLVLNLASASRVFGEVEHRRNTAAAAASTSAAPTAPGAAAAPAAAGLANKAIWKPPPPLLLLLLLLLLLAAATVTVVVVAVVTVAAVLLLARPRSRPRPAPSAARAAAAAAAAPPIIVTSPPVVVSGAMTVVAAAATAATAATAAATPIAVVTVTVTVTTVRSSTLHGVRPGVLRLYSCARRDPLKWSPFRRNHNHTQVSRFGVQRPKNLEKNTFYLKGIFVNGTMKPAGSRAVVARTMAGMMEEVTDGGSSCRIHIFRRVPRAAATCLISARVELPSLHPPPHGLPLAAAAARPGPATSTTPCSFLPPQDI